jgi:hypothetical protein
MPWVEQTEAPATTGKWVEAEDTADNRSPLTKAVNTVARATESTGARALAGIVGMGGDMPTLLESLMKKGGFPEGPQTAPNGMPLPRLKNPFPTSADVMAFLENVAGYRAYQPTSKIGQYADAIGSGAAQAAVLGGANLPAILAGGVGAAGSKIGGDIFPKSPLAQIAGGVIGGLAGGGFGSLLRPTPSAVAKNILNDSQTGIDDAAALQRTSIDAGLGPLTAPEALNSKYGLSVQRLLEQEPEGAATKQVMTNRGPAAARASGQQVEDILPGATPREGITALETAGNKAIAEQMKVRASKAGPFYRAAEGDMVQSQSLLGLLTKIDDMVAAKGAASETGRALTELKSRVQSSMNGHLANVGPLEATYKEFRDRLSRPGMETASLSGAESSSNGAVSSVVGDLGKLLETENANIASGRAAHIAATPEVDALAKGLVGDLTSSRSLSSAAATFMNPKNETPADIARAAQALSKQNAEAVPALVQQYLRDKLEAAKGAVQGDTSRLGAKFNQATLGASELAPRQAKNIETAIRALPNGDDVWSGFEKVMSVYKAQGNRYVPGSATAYNQVIREGLKDEGMVLGSARAVSTMGRSVWDGIKNARLRSTYSVLDRVFSSPDSVQQLQAIAREPSVRRQQIMISSFMGGRAGNAAPNAQ